MRAKILVVLILVCAGVCSADDPYTVVAHYYPWYGGNQNPHWPNGVAHRPWIGYYFSGSPDVARQQVDLASRYGVDVFAVGWTGINSPGERNFRSGLLKAPNLNRIRFCMVYDSLGRLRGENSAPLYFDFNDPAVRQMFISDVVYLAKQYFGNPRYFKIDGRPVLKIYLTRRFFGEFPSALEEARRQLRTMGWDPYLVGDDLFYGRNDLFVISQFDAATAYNLNNEDLRRSGITTTGKLADAIRPFYWNFMYQLRDIQVAGRDAKVDLQPGVIPQFDARVARHTSVALLAQNKQEVVKMFNVAKEIVDAKASGPRVVWITSWNEWHEGTAIEPTISSGAKYPGGNYGFDFLEALADVFSQ